MGRVPFGWDGQGRWPGEEPVLERPEVAALHMSPVPRLGSHGPGGCGGRGSRVLFWWLWDVTGAEEQLELASAFWVEKGGGPRTQAPGPARRLVRSPRGGLWLGAGLRGQ